jgi:hypothetical protein
LPAGLTIGATTNVTVTNNKQQFGPATASVTRRSLQQRWAIA